jgi:hypothetical protein
MKKEISKIALATIIIWSLLLSAVCYAQEAATVAPATVTPRFILGITSGVSIPLGSFARTDYYNSNSGFAGAGGNYGLSGTWMLSKHWGIAELFSYQQFSFAGGQNMALGMQSFPGGFDVDSVNFKVRGNNHTFNFLAGPVYTMRVGKKLDVDIRLLGGFVNANLAGNNITLTDGGITDPTFYQAVSWANTFGGQLGAALRYHVTQHIGVALNADFFYSKPDFEVNNINRNNNAGREIFIYDEPVEGVNANITLSYSFML